MKLKDFTDNHLINFTEDQIKKIFDLEAIEKLPNTDIEKNRIRLLSQYMVGNVSETFEEIKAEDKAEQRRIFMTWFEVIRNAPTLRQLSIAIIVYLSEK